MLARNVNILQLANACRRCARARTSPCPYVHAVCPYDMYIALEIIFIASIGGLTKVAGTTLAPLTMALRQAITSGNRYRWRST